MTDPRVSYRGYPLIGAILIFMLGVGELMQNKLIQQTVAYVLVPFALSFVGAWLYWVTLP